MTRALTPLFLPVVGPYDFTLSTLLFSRGDPAIRRSEGGRFWQVIRIATKLLFIEVSSLGRIEEPLVGLQVMGNIPPTSEDRTTAGRFASRILNLEEDLKPFYESVQEDPVMQSLVERLRGLKSPTTQTLFEALVDSIIEQQISLIVAHSLESRLVRMYGDRLIVRGETYYAFPTPESLAQGTAEGFRSCGLSVRKGEYVRDIARKFVDGEITPERWEGRIDSESIIEELCRYRGIGRWTAELSILRGLHRVDTIPADDLGIRRSISARYCNGRKITAMETRRIASRWGNYQGLACFYLLVADQLGI